MAYDENAAQRLRAELGTLPGLTEKKMFGGIVFLLGGNMVCGVLGDDLIMRVPARRSTRPAWPSQGRGRSTSVGGR